MEIVLSYGSATLRQADIALLEPTRWLNDMLIAFYFEWLSKDLDPRVLLVDPSAVFIMKFEDDIEDLRMQFGKLRLASRDVILCPVNDNDDPHTPAGGSHWTLLAYFRGVIYSYDSGGSRSLSASAATVAHCLYGLLETDPQPVIVVRLLHPQTNSYDCGTYVVLISELLTKSWQTEPFTLETLQSEITPLTASAMRLKISFAIETLRRDARLTQ